MRAFQHFAKEYLGNTIVAVAGALFTVGGMLSDAYSFWTANVPPMAMSALGAVMFFGAIAMLLFRWHRDHIAPLQISSGALGNVEAKQEPPPNQPAGDTLTATGLIDDVGCTLYCGRVMVGYSRLAEDLIIEITAVAFNGSRYAVQLASIDGMIRWEPWPSPNESSLRPLPKPIVTIGGDTNPGFAPYAEAAVVIEQRVPKAEALAMRAALDGEGWDIDLRKLDLRLLVPGRPELKLRVPLWHAAHVRAGKSGETQVARVTMASIKGIALTTATTNLG